MSSSSISSAIYWQPSSFSFWSLGFKAFDLGLWSLFFLWFFQHSIISSLFNTAVWCFQGESSSDKSYPSTRGSQESGSDSRNNEFTQHAESVLLFPGLFLWNIGGRFTGFGAGLDLIDIVADYHVFKSNWIYYYAGGVMLWITVWRIYNQYLGQYSRRSCFCSYNL